jgi:hypothetical protein
MTQKLVKVIAKTFKTSFAAASLWVPGIDKLFINKDTQKDCHNKSTFILVKDKLRQ